MQAVFQDENKSPWGYFDLVFVIYRAIQPILEINETTHDGLNGSVNGLVYPPSVTMWIWYVFVHGATVSILRRRYLIAGRFPSNDPKFAYRTARVSNPVASNIDWT